MKNWFWCILLRFEIFIQRVHCENTKIYILKPQLWLLAQNALTKWVLNMYNFCLKYPFIWDATTKHLEKQKKKNKKNKKKTEIISAAKKLWKGRCNFIFNFFSFSGWNYKCSKEKRKKKKRLKMKFTSSVLWQCPMVNCGAYYTSNFFIPTIWIFFF